MKGYLLAAGLGYLAGILWAPRKGSLLRADIQNHFKEGQEQITHIVQPAIQHGQEVVSDVVKRGQEIKTDATQRVGRASESLALARETATETINKLGEDAQKIAEKSKTIFAQT